MFKKLTKNLFISFSFVIITLSFSQSFALSSASLSIDKQNIDINDNVILNIVIKSDWWSEILIKDIKWMENFEVVSQSQSQSSNSQLEVINWKTESKTEISHTLSLKLQAKVKWEFEIWPAKIVEWTWTLDTNSVKLEVEGTKLFINWSNSQQNQINSQNPTNLNSKNNTQTISSPNNEENKIEDFWESNEKLIFDNNNILYLFLIILILTSIWFYFLLRNSSFFVSDKTKNKLIKNNEENNEFEFESDPEDIYKKEEIEKIVYPDLTDENFVEKIDEIFNWKIRNNFWIKNYENKTYKELLENIETEKKDQVEEFMNLLAKAKYSNIVSDKNKLLYLINEM